MGALRFRAAHSATVPLALKKQRKSLDRQSLARSHSASRTGRPSPEDLKLGTANTSWAHATRQSRTHAPSVRGNNGFNGNEASSVVGTNGSDASPASGAARATELVINVSLRRMLPAAA